MPRNKGKGFARLSIVLTKGLITLVFANGAKEFRDPCVSGTHNNVRILLCRAVLELPFH